MRGHESVLIFSIAVMILVIVHKSLLIFRVRNHQTTMFAFGSQMQALITGLCVAIAVVPHEVICSRIRPRYATRLMSLRINRSD